MSRERARRIALAPAQENIEKIKKVVEEGNYYGAQQMYKSIGARYISSDRYSEALDFLQSGACIQLENGQVTCGAELAVLFVETLVKGKFPYDDDTLDRIKKIYKKFPRISVPQHLDLADDDDMQQLSEALAAAKTRAEGCSSFLKAAIKWSIEFGAHRNGPPEIHDMLADYIYSESPESDMAKVSYHFVRGKNPKKFASALVNFMGKCYPGEDDLAVARAVLICMLLDWPLVPYRLSFRLLLCKAQKSARHGARRKPAPFSENGVGLCYDGGKEGKRAKACLLQTPEFAQFFSKTGLRLVQIKGDRWVTGCGGGRVATGAKRHGTGRGFMHHQGGARQLGGYLALGNLRDANVLMDEMKKQVQVREVDFPRSELMQLVNYLLKTLERDALPLFNMLRQRYKSSIDREPIFNELLDEVAEKFYGVQRRNAMPGMFGDIFKMISGE
ncbi:UNVERIFIED_CONTAM: Golgi to ER traffic protein 4 [Sesamum radiatum]|uniref:Golgi to ER traffic protein 4 n=1 Tax=Sesamum radiatum TaxID=300843 RepID=A0AAW2V9I9_SESRA